MKHFKYLIIYSLIIFLNTPNTYAGPEFIGEHRSQRFLPTTKIDLSVELDDQTSTGKSQFKSYQVIDDFGDSHTLRMRFRKRSSSKWMLSITADDAVSIQQDSYDYDAFYYKRIPLEFSSSGRLTHIDGYELDSDRSTVLLAPTVNIIWETEDNGLWQNYEDELDTHSSNITNNAFWTKNSTGSSSRKNQKFKKSIPSYLITNRSELKLDLKVKIVRERKRSRGRRYKSEITQYCAPIRKRPRVFKF